MESRSEDSDAHKIQAVIPRSVIMNLVIFSLLIMIAPLATYYLLYYILSFSSTFSGISAAVSANIVLTCYIIIAFLEDDQLEGKKEK